ncbi:hypothetical protein SAMN06296386_109120 [Lachnospiraceae bacterium]|nr:hypothetical protein SAMN06296386_109120 [Lachnospiraceae bacterium]
MKVFISGSKSLIDNTMLPKSVQSCLNKIISEGHEIFIGDCWGTDTVVQTYLRKVKYKKVVVYVSGSKGSTRNNLGHWTENHFSTNGSTPYVYRIEKDFHMTEDCDYGVAIWDGDSKGTFINMLCLCALNKTCSLYHLKEERWIEINELEDLRKLSGPEGAISEEDILEVLTKCGFSDEMRQYLTFEKTISPYSLLDIICGAPITLDEKSHLLSLIGKKRNLKYDAFTSVAENIKQRKDFNSIKHDIRALADYKGKDAIWNMIYDRYKEILAAKEGLYSGSVDLYPDKPLNLFAEWYDTEELQLKSSSCGIFTNPKLIETYIENEESDNDADEGFYRAEAWDMYDHDWSNPRYDYYYYNGKICWFEKLIPKKQDNGNTYYMVENRDFSCGRHDLNLSTPYKPGDIVLIDCRPFGPPFHAMILEARHQYDCCFPNIIFHFPGTEEWEISSLKHKEFFDEIRSAFYVPMLSPLYRIKKVGKQEMTEDDDRLIILSNVISGNEEKAERVWQNLRSENFGNLSWSKVMRIFEIINEKNSL